MVETPWARRPYAVSDYEHRCNKTGDYNDRLRIDIIDRAIHVLTENILNFDIRIFEITRKVDIYL